MPMKLTPKIAMTMESIIYVKRALLRKDLG